MRTENKLSVAEVSGERPASTALIESLVTAARGQGVKVLFVTHDIGQARRLADEIIFLHQGQVAEQGSAQAFFASPKTAAAKAYLDGRIDV